MLLGQQEQFGNILTLQVSLCLQYVFENSGLPRCGALFGKQLIVYIYIYSYFEKGCRKKCTRQSRKALWVVLSLLFFKDIWKNWYESPEEMCLRVLKEGNKSRFDGYSRQKQRIDYLPYYLSGLSRAHFSDNLCRNSCIQKCLCLGWQEQL